MRNALATIKGSAGRGNVSDVLLGDWLIIERSVGETMSHRINHDFQQANHGIKLTGIKPVHQFVRVLLLLGGRHHR